jgi:eukaryotic-like serine/threonine-protein kinase
MPESFDHYDARSTAVDNDPFEGYDPDAMGSETVQVGSELFGYRLTAILGKGGMGTVYKAEQLSLGREVAVKVLHSARIRSQEQVDRFLHEARAAGRLNHPNLVAVHDAHADPEQGLYCYSMELVPGHTLGRLLKDRGPLPRPTALHVLYQVAKALGHAHKNGLIHRDVKPDNILVTSQGVAKLADLGLVRDRLEGIASSGSGNRRLTIVGTPEYSAPEQSRNPAKASPASDIYSLGAVLYTMLVGKPPFNGETVIDLIVSAATDEPVLPSNMAPDCKQLLGHLLAKHPDDRYGNGDELAAALEALAKGQGLPAPSGRRSEQDETEGAMTSVDDQPIEPSGPQRQARRRMVRRRR